MNANPNWPRIPAALRERAQWAITPGTDADKAPRQTSGAHASSTNASTWTIFEAACAEAARRDWHIGFMLSAGDPFACIDLDVKDDTPDESKELYLRIIDSVASYTEGSRSGKGAHIWVLGKIGAGHKRGGVEVYSQERFIVCTGNVWRDQPIEQRQAILTNMVSMMKSDDQTEVPDEPEEDSDTEIIARATDAANADKFNALSKGEWKALNYKSQSEADCALLSIICFWTKNNSQARRIFRLTELGKREKATKDNRYLNKTITMVRSRQAAENQRAKAFAASPVVQAVHAAIASTEAHWGKKDAEAQSPAPELSLDQMRKALVLVQGTFVAFLDNPNNAQAFDQMRKHLARNVTTWEDDKGREKSRATLDFWLENGARETAECFGFDPGKEGSFFKNDLDHGKKAINLWRPLPRLPAELAGMAALAFPFVQHVEYLIPDPAQRAWFLDWCAHIVQKPGELPQHHWLMWTETQGIGRNTMCRILARAVGEAYVSQNFQLSHYLKSGFNGDLSHRILVFVDEVKEGLNRQHEDKFKEMVTTDVRHINPKTLPERHEKNCARWILLTQHANAIPMGVNDRRFNVVKNPETPKDEAYYTRLNEAADDPEFIACVREWLWQRDISGFKVGRRAELTDAKREVIAASAPPEFQRAHELIAQHTRDLIASRDLFFAVFERYPMPNDNVTWQQLRAIAKQTGMVKLPEFNYHGVAYNVWILRNEDEWKSAAKWQIANEFVN